MSTSQFVARYTLQNGADATEPAFNLFATGMDILSGDLTLYRKIMIDRLSSRGVDGMRTRRRHRMFDDIILRLTEPLPAGKTFGDRESEYNQAQGRVGGLSVRVNNQTLVWPKTVAEVATMQESRLPSALIGYGSVSGSGGTLVTQWTFIRLDEGYIA